MLRLLLAPILKNLQMRWEAIRDYIVENEKLPPTFFFTDSGEERDLDVLVATSTLREGFNLRESSAQYHLMFD